MLERERWGQSPVWTRPGRNWSGLGKGEGKGLERTEEGERKVRTVNERSGGQRSRG